MSDTKMVWLNFPLFRGWLNLKRTPKYLRFVCSGIATCQRNWDALDQLDDEPRSGEWIIAGVLSETSSIHLDRVVKGRRVGEWYATATYAPIEPQPDDAIMRDTERWREWCYSQEPGL